MYAIVEIAGQQFKVSEEQRLFVHRLDGEEGAKVSFTDVLLLEDGSKIEVGTPAVQGVEVSAKILRHLKGDKVIVFKKKRRKGYKVKNGHRQLFSEIQINKIIRKKAKATEKKETTKKEATPKDGTKKPAAKKAEETAKKVTKKAAPKKSAAAKTGAKKPAAKKSTAKKSVKKTDKKED